MDAQRAIHRIVAILVLVIGAGRPVFAGPAPVTYGGNFNLPLNDPIGPGSALTEAAIEVIDHFVITDLNVEINITHTRIFDLQLILQSPDGTGVCLNKYEFDEIFEGENYTETVFDDEAEISIEDAVAPFTGRFRPETGYLLGSFDGQDACGTWLLRIYDMWPVNTGELDSAELVFNTPEPASAVIFGLGGLLFAIGRRCK